VARSIREIMTPPPLCGLVTLGPDDAVEEAIGLIRAHAVRRIPVEAQGHPLAS
jgi:CBS domain-containing protein